MPTAGDDPLRLAHIVWNLHGGARQGRVSRGVTALHRLQLISVGPTGNKPPEPGLHDAVSAPEQLSDTLGLSVTVALPD